MGKIKLKKFLHGGDYNPDQWTEDVWEKDIEYMKYYNVNAVSMPIFSWAQLQPNEDEFTFEWLDKIIDKLYSNGIHVILATPTASQPAWLSKKYPDVLPVDIHGRKRKHGARQNYCPNSPNFKNAARRIVEEMVKRYKDHPAVIMWHISNEYGPYCYCENCAKAFREWLKERYKTLDELNKRWNTAFWGHTFYDWDEIEVPSYLNEEFEYMPGRQKSSFQGLSLDYKRFMSDSLLNLYKMEVEIIKKYMPDIPVTTNLMGPFKPLDYHKWAKHMDIVSWDNYPSIKDSPSSIAFKHDLMRGLKRDQSWILMEQTPSQTNWQWYNSAKRPGMIRLLSYHAIAHGADSVLYFQWRQSVASCEKFHSAMVPHVGHLETRVSKELKKIGDEILRLDEILESTTKSEVALLFDWENWWALEESMGFRNDISYLEHVDAYYRALYKLKTNVDVVDPKEELTRYKLVVAPLLYLLDQESAKNIENYVKNGGIFITTYLSGLVDENDRVILGGYPGWFRKLCGIWVEEIDALFPDMKNAIILAKPIGILDGKYECDFICDIIHLEGARALAYYEQDYYCGMPAVVENNYGNGKAIYIGTRPEKRFIEGLVKFYAEKAGIQPILPVPEGVEVTKREKNGNEYVFLLNFNGYDVNIELKDEYYELITQKVLGGKATLAPKEVMILRRLKD
ncbi:Beta-galactosidase [Caldicellulosiruptor kronotskyensis 2002]|uniref:Beta-galactosidase n=1 Tax=Caldicellulosiruptor kronotskyensis (strain DSM 18902 / VKM B-2412 / 2002) TaxID=632348 RepID=E4SB15_CALK2|nr:beta-galactosidase [Caldicellulosiruptor kronotskyensis]ADQ45670.1 Beta-galactosidase [Caldicellulosiruptor kronotskyensis 2002]